MSDADSFGRAKAPFNLASAAHTVARTAEALNWDFSDLSAFMRRAQQVEYGLSAEIEFAAILRWLGVCKFIHRLNEDRLSDPTFTELEVPDLFGIFEHNGSRITALIEVKTSEGLELGFTQQYLNRLEAYGKQVGQPLLIAWRPRDIGFWVLFDPRIAVTNGERLVVPLSEALKNDLMGILAGDFSLVAAPGAGLHIVAKRIGEKQPTEMGYEAMYEITEACFFDATGMKWTKLSNAISSLLLSMMEHDEQINDDGIVKSFVVAGGMTKAQLVLRVAVGFTLKNEERIHWKGASKRLDLVLKSTDLLAEAQQSFGTFVQYVLFQQPRKVPDFLLPGWRGPYTANESG